MHGRALKDRVHWVGALDWDRRLFDEFIPLPDGTTYNAYLVRGSQKTALVDTVEPAFADVLLARLRALGVERLDYVVANHAEQDHSGSLPAVLGRYPAAQVLATPKGKGLLLDLLELPPDRVQVVGDGETLSLGDRTLRFLHFPWVHWPETMVTWLAEDRLLFSGDLFGAHLVAGDLAPTDDGTLLEAAKRYYAELMMAHRSVIQGNLPRLAELPIEAICPSHGPVMGRASLLLDAYRDWISDTPRNRAVLAYASMHASTQRLIQHLAEALLERGVAVDLFNLAHADLGKLAIALVDAATLVLGSPTVNGGAHPLVANAAYVANLLRPKARFGAVVGSYGWAGKTAKQLAELMPNLKLEMLEPVVAKGLPRAADFAAVDRLANDIAARHAGLAAA